MIDVAPPIGQYAPDFELPGINSSVHHLARYLETWKAVVVVMLSHACPEVEACIQTLKALQSEFAPQQLTLVGINSNDEKQMPEDSFEQMKNFAKSHDLNFPYLRDVTQDVARTFGAEKTPQVFLLDTRGRICYTGAIQGPSGSADTSTPYLKEAIAQLLSNQPITVPVTPATGCPIHWRKPPV